MLEGPAHSGWYYFWVGSLGLCKRSQESRLVNSIPPWPLLQCLPLGSCPGFQQWWSAIRTHTPNKLFPPHINSFVMIFTTATGSKLGTGGKCTWTPSVKWLAPEKVISMTKFTQDATVLLWLQPDGYRPREDIYLISNFPPLTEVWSPSVMRRFKREPECFTAVRHCNAWPLGEQGRFLPPSFLFSSFLFFYFPFLHSFFSLYFFHLRWDLVTPSRVA